MTIQPPHVGAPPLPPQPPEHHQPQHLVHLILTVLTGGFWLVIWGIAALNAQGANDQERKRYERELAEYGQAYDDWQDRHHMRYADPRVWR